MQTVETQNEGLKRAYRMTITAKDVESRIDAEVKKIAPQVRMPGFPSLVRFQPIWSRKCIRIRCFRTR